MGILPMNTGLYKLWKIDKQLSQLCLDEPNFESNNFCSNLEFSWKSSQQLKIIFRIFVVRVIKVIHFLALNFCSNLILNSKSNALILNSKSKLMLNSTRNRFFMRKPTWLRTQNQLQKIPQLFDFEFRIKFDFEFKIRTKILG